MWRRWKYFLIWLVEWNLKVISSWLSNFELNSDCIQLTLSPYGNLGCIFIAEIYTGFNYDTKQYKWVFDPQTHFRSVYHWHDSTSKKKNGIYIDVIKYKMSCICFSFIEIKAATPFLPTTPAECIQSIIWIVIFHQQLSFGVIIMEDFSPQINFFVLDKNFIFFNNCRRWIRKIIISKIPQTNTNPK